MTRVTGVCWSITSDTSTPYGETAGPRQGSSRAWTAYQWSRSASQGVGSSAAMALGSQAMVTHPVGPLPASTYWRRRVVMLLGLLLLLLLVRSCASGGSPPVHKKAVKPRPTPTSTPSPASPTVAPTRPSSAGACADGSLQLTTTTDAGTYALGATPKITLVVKNTSAAACRRDLGAGAVELLVYSGTDRVWSSDDCNPSTATALTQLGAGGTQAVVKTWPGSRSLPGCTGSQAAAKAGTYRVVARLGSLRVDGAVFRLHS